MMLHIYIYRSRVGVADGHRHVKHHDYHSSGKGGGASEEHAHHSSIALAKRIPGSQDVTTLNNPE